jgi:hypothetical protein
MRTISAEDLRKAISNFLDFKEIPNQTQVVSYEVSPNTSIGKITKWSPYDRS